MIFAGLPDSFESEGYDRSHMRMPDCQNELIREILKVQPNTVVVLHNGSPVEMPWADDAPAILESYLCGQAVGEAQVRLLFGLANPCGKLAETIPFKLQDNPSYLNFPGDGHTVGYQEGVFVGYRYYDTKEMAVRYPFGHGLSYTTFSYSDLTLSADQIKDTDTLRVSLKVKNTGNMAGKEIVQLYVADHTGCIFRPAKELKNFVKVFLEPGEEKTVSMELDKRSFAWYSTDLHDWYAAPGEYEILACASSRDIRLRATVRLTTRTRLPLAIHRNTTVAELLANPKTAAVISSMTDALAANISGDAENSSEAAAEAITKEMSLKMLENSPLRSFKSFVGMDEKELADLIERLKDALEKE